MNLIRLFRIRRRNIENRVFHLASHELFTGNVERFDQFLENAIGAVTPAKLVGQLRWHDLPIIGAAQEVAKEANSLERQPAIESFISDDGEIARARASNNQLGPLLGKIGAGDL